MPTSEFNHFSGTTRFQILRELGAGGMGVVYEAFDTERNQRVALKTMKNVDPRAIYDFKKEFRALAEIVHPNLIPLHELIFDQQWFFVMELLEDPVDFQSYVLGSDEENIANVAIETQHHFEERGNRPETKTEIEKDNSPDTPEVHIEPTIIPESQGQADLALSDSSSSSSVDGESDDHLCTLKDSMVTIIDQTIMMEIKSDTFAEEFDESENTIISSDQFGTIGIPQIFDHRDHKKKTSQPAGLASIEQSSRSKVLVKDFKRLRDSFRQLCAGVRALHRAGILHRDLKPANALVTRTGTVVLLDFGLALELSALNVSGAHIREVTGTIGYMAPEQALGLSLTEAADWYSVGVMLFQLLTGRLPITGTSTQILRLKTWTQPPAPADLVDGVPDDLNELCVKLLRIDPNKRPCGNEIAAFFADGEVLPIEEGVGPKELPFIGREQQLSELYRSYEDAKTGRTVTCRIQGRSGAGKSALIQTFLGEISARNEAVIVAGRCYEQESVPFKGIDSLIDGLTQFLRSTDLPLFELLPKNIAGLALIFPVLNRIKIIAKQSENNQVASDLRQLRRDAFEALRELFRRIGDRKPLVVYLDDLQWGDADSAALLSELLSNQNNSRMLFLIAYRTEYEGTSDCLQTLFGEIRPAHNADVREIRVEPLSLNESQLLARSLLRADLPNIDESINQIVEQSGGSAYFVYELAQHLNSGIGLESVKGTTLDDVLWSRVSRLPAEAQRFLHVVAVSGQPTQLRNVLEAAGLESLSPRMIGILRTEHFIRTSGPGLHSEVEAFHDRIRETVSDRLPIEVRKSHHSKLGESLERSGHVAPETIAGHLERSDQFERAGRLYALAADLALKKLAFDRAEEFAKHSVRLSRSDEDLASAYERLIHFYTDMARFAEAYTVGREAAGQFGAPLPYRFIPPLFVIDLLEAKWALIGRKTADIVDLPMMKNERMTKAVRMINAVAKAAYQVRPELCVAISTKVVNLCLKYGLTSDSAIGWMVFGAIFQGGVMGQHLVGYEFGRLALSLVDKFQNERQRAEVTFVVGYFGTSWLRPSTEAEELWRTTYESGRATGDLFHTGCACAATTQSMFMRGEKLEIVNQTLEGFLDFLRPMNLREPIGAVMSVRQTIRNLCGQTRDRLTFTDCDFDEANYEETLRGYGSRHFAHYYYVNKMLSQYLWGDYDTALETSRVSQNYLKDSPGMLHSAEHHFLVGLIKAGIAHQAKGFHRRRLIRAVESSHRRLRRWAAQCYQNFEHKAQILAAEYANLTGTPGTAVTCYKKAISAASENGDHHVEAIAEQLFSRFLSRLGNNDEAALHRNRASVCFEEWGATAHLETDS